MPKSGQVARVAVDEEAWLEFRQAALARGISVSEYLGRLVQRELKRRAGREVANVTPEMPAGEQALAALAEVRASIDELDGIAGQLAWSAIQNDRTWGEVGEKLRIPSERAKSSYGRDR
jgi:hypothetical protein